MDGLWEVEIQKFKPEHDTSIHGALAQFVGWRTFSYHRLEEAALQIFHEQREAGHRVRLTSPEQS